MDHFCSSLEYVRTFICIPHLLSFYTQVRDTHPQNTQWMYFKADTRIEHLVAPDVVVIKTTFVVATDDKADILTTFHFQVFYGDILFHCTEISVLFINPVEHSVISDITSITPRPGPWFNIKMLPYQYRKSHCGDKTVVRSSYLHNGLSYTGKTTSLYWIRALGLYSLSERTPANHMIWPREALKPRDSGLDLCRGVCEMSQWYGYYIIQSRGFETLRH